ncbi:actin-5-like [Mixophyes fleayi]|uniref:actin-5-like n=1 Tax=Mixophyes fleayi TaxID=3061075 RepID=UPI003F4DE913
MHFGTPAVIFDNGSGLCKAGIAGDGFPKFVIASVVGRSRVRPAMLGLGQKEYYIGEDAQSSRGVLSLIHPVERGIITSWDGIEKLWNHVYDCKLQLKASERPVLLTEAPLNPLQNREKMAEIMFEGFKVPGMYIGLQAVLTLYASGITTGMFMNSGDGVTHMVPVYEGYCLPHAVARLDLAGRDITECLMRLLLEIGYSFVSTAEREIVRDIKEKLCYVQVEPKDELTNIDKEMVQDYNLPDGNTITIGSQLFRAPEILFAPINVGIEAPGIHELLFKSIMKCPIDIRRNLYSSIVLSGGSTLFPGLDERISTEMKHLVPNGVPIKLISPPDREYSVWIGASIISCLSAFRDLWVTSSDYEDFGPSAVHQKCF